MKSNTEKIAVIAKKFLEKKKFSFTKMDIPVFISKDDKFNENKYPDYWTVAYEYKVFDEETAFVYVDDQTEKVLYILTGHRRIYEEEEIVEDDGEDWEDLYKN